MANTCKIIQGRLSCLPRFSKNSSTLTEFTHVSTPLDYWHLLKPRVMSLVIFTGIVGLLLAPGSIHPLIAILSIFCIAIGSGASGALNMWYERDIDALMDRTKTRPLPQKKIQPGEALGFGLILAIGAVMVMFSLLNFLSAFYLALAILLYVGVYTIWLKRKTSQNIVIGGAAGALPPVIGWASVMNETSLLPWILFGIIFLWTPPHFWALALYRHEDYVKAKIPMLPVVSGIEATKNQILIYILILIPLTLFPVYLGIFGLFYTVASILLGLIFVALGIKVKLSSSSQESRQLFFFSILYLFLLFSAMLVDKLLFKMGYS